jgi:hypothetical protein
MARVCFDDLWYFLFDLVDGGEALEMRASAAAVAEPDLVADKQQAQNALGLHAEILAKVAATPAEARRSDAFKSLRQGLGYTLSVVIAGNPAPGAALMRAWAGSKDPDIQWILKENLKKKRLLRVIAEHPEYIDLLEKAGLPSS